MAGVTPALQKNALKSASVVILVLIKLKSWRVEQVRLLRDFMAYSVDHAAIKKCFFCKKTKNLQHFTKKGLKQNGSIRYDARCKSCKNKGGGVSWLPRSATHKTCRNCGVLKPRSDFKPKSRNELGEVINWMPVCIGCHQKSVSIVRMPRTDTHKTCSECMEIKTLSDFSTGGKLKNGLYKVASKCRQCVRQIKKSPEQRAKRLHYYRLHSDRIKSSAKESYQRHKQKRVAQKAIYRQINREKILNWFKKKREENPEFWNEKNRASYAKHAEKRRLYRKEYVKNFPDKVFETNRKQNKKRYASGKAQAYNKEFRRKNREKLREYERNYRKTDINRNISLKLRNRINAVLRYNKKSKPTEDLLGCSVSELAIHLESRFEEGMTWEKFLRGEIHLDHIVPCALFDLSLSDEQAECFHFSNLQPLWATDNLRKPKHIDPTGKRSKAANIHG
jgi:hypothetical protein